jgi:hypothetical protein
MDNQDGGQNVPELHQPAGQASPRHNARGGCMMDKTIAAAIVKTMREIPRLAKTERNAFAKYDYASVDDFYRHVVPVALANGLFWNVREVERVAGPSNITFTYAFDLMHESGAAIPSYSTMTILHPIQGAQTAGSAASYADKVFCRTTFKVVTGEPDADATDPRPELKMVAQKQLVQMNQPDETDPQDMIAGTNPEKAPLCKVPSTPEGWSTVLRIFEQWLPEVRTKQDLVNFYSDNAKVMELAQKNAPQVFADIKSKFTARKLELQ